LATKRKCEPGATTHPCKKPIRFVYGIDLGPTIRYYYQRWKEESILSLVGTPGMLLLQSPEEGTALW